MRKLCVSFSIFLLLGGACTAAAETVQIKHLASAYVDGDGKKLNYPEGVACRGDYFLVADTGNSRIVRYSFKNKTLAAEGQFPLENAYPIVVQMNSKGEIYYLDGKERRIAQVGPAGEPKGYMKFSGVAQGEAVVLRSFRIDNEDNIHLLDISSEKVVIVNPEGKFIKSIPFPEKYGFFSDLAIDPRGKIFLLDSVNAVVYSQNEKNDGFSPLTKNMKEYMNFPTGIAIDRVGQIYLSDQFGSGLALVGRDGSFLGSKIGMGWIDSQVFYPSQVCINGSDELFIADRSNSRVQVFGVAGK